MPLFALLLSRVRCFRHSILLAIVLCWAIVLCCAVLPAWADQPAEFTVVLLPDTQFYSETYPDTYVAQTEWIKRSADEKNTKFVIHLGDIVQNPGVEAEWKNADRAHQVLDGAVPYSVLPGNHDMDPAVRDTTLYDKYFPPKRFEGCPWYGGHEGAGNENNYCLFEAGGMKFLVLSLAYHPTEETLKWADGVLQAHPEHRAIVATHEYMARKGRREVGQRLFDRLIRKQPNVFMVVSGHVTGVGHQTSANDAGGKVHEILCDYQGLPNGGSGWLATMRFVPAENKIHVEAYSPLLDEHKTKSPDAYTIDYRMAADEPAKIKAEEILEATGTGGGLVVHVGCGDGTLTADLRAGDAYLVQGLDRDAANVEKARRHVESLGLTGKVSIDRWQGKSLPYVDNLVNLAVVSDPADVTANELLRALAPGGVAYVKEDGGWKKTVKPWPEAIDEWSHFLHDASGNAVAKDAEAGPPRGIQWMGAPRWSRNHHKLASISAVVSTQGRLFYIVDEGPAGAVAAPPRWFITARDAFSGVQLWKRRIASWAYHLKGFRSGPVQLPRTLVADQRQVYLPLGVSAPVTVLDAATGKVLQTYGQTAGTEEIILSDGVLLAVTGSPTSEQSAVDPARRGEAPYPNRKSIVALDTETGKTLWKWSEADARVTPVTLAASDGHVYFAAGEGAVCLDLASGKELWNTSQAAAEEPEKDQASQKSNKKKPKKKSNSRSAGWAVATLVVDDGVVLLADRGQLKAMSAVTGEALWGCPIPAGFKSASDVFVVDGLVWIGPNFSDGRDLRTGEVKKQGKPAGEIWTVGHHHRCYREKATERFIMTGKRGIEFVDLEGEEHTRNNWVRGTCQYGIMPCNGLVYAPPHACGCFMESKLFGFYALTPDVAAGSEADETILEQGPAFGQVPWKTAAPKASGDWPTLRHDPLRSGSTAMKLPPALDDVWSVKLGGRLSAPVVADGTVVVSAIDAHRVVALDAASGKQRWTFTAGGRVDSPPTLYRGLALFGCADGWVYCLRLDDGRLVWRFRAAPADRKTVALDQIESVWPVHGSVLVQDGVAYFAAGRSSYLDGGIRLFGVDPATGKLLCQSRVENDHPKAAEEENTEGIPGENIVQNKTDYKTTTSPDLADAFSMEGATSDVLVGDGESVFMRHLRFDEQCRRQPKLAWHLFSTSQLLDGAENHRSHWVLGTGDFSRTPVAYSWITYRGDGFGSRLAVPYGLMLSFDEETVWGVRRARGNGENYTLFAKANEPPAADAPHLPDFRRSEGLDPISWQWTTGLPMRPRAILQAGDALVLGGMPASSDEQDPFATFEGQEGGTLWIASTTDGAKLSGRTLKSPPVWDGMAAAAGRLYVSTADGSLLCLGTSP